ncbi:MAG: MFS transporter, partial [Polyangiaceae bacterium]
MLAPYRAIFAAPGTKGFCTAGFLARMPNGLYAASMVTMLSELRGSFSLAGSVMAIALISVAVVGPQVSRLVDRFGQRRVIIPTAALSVLANVGLLLCAHFDAAAWTLFFWSALTGCTPNIGAMIRARWAALYRDEPTTLHTAYSFESVLDELCFIVGPILGVSLSTAWFPEAGMLLATVLLAAGATLLAPQRSTEPPVHALTPTIGEPAQRSFGLWTLVVAFTAFGAGSSAIQVTTIAFAEQHGSKASASVVLAMSALGSCAAGIVAGLVRPKRTPERRLLLALLVSGGCTLLLPLAGNLPVLSVVLFVVGVTGAPVMICSMALVERLVPASQLTEGFTWTNTGMVVGVAAGSSIAGWVVDHTDASTAYWVPVASGTFALTTVALGWRWLSNPSRRS